jgi:hypothetical protein
MGECAAGAMCGGLHDQAQLTTLQNLFYRLCKLLRTPANFVFVFDGSERPPVKCGKQVGRQVLWWAPLAKHLVSRFRYASHQVFKWRESVERPQFEPSLIGTWRG